MTMKPIFEIHLDGQMDRPSLERFTKLLNLRPRGRLTDTEDAEFGHRALRDTPNERVWLDLWRRHTSGWAVRLTFAGPPLPPAVVVRCRAEVLGAAGALGLTVAGIRPAPPEPVPVATRLELPTRRALVARLAGGRRMAGRLGVAERDTLQKVLHLRWELGGLAGTEFGWRYLHWDPSGGSLLLQLFDHPDTGTEIALLYDRQPPPEEVVAECWSQMTVAAAEAGMTLTRVFPEPPAETNAAGDTD